MKKLILALFLPMIISLPAHALFEIRGGYGLITPSEDFSSGAELSSIAGFNADAIFELPMFPLGLGLRYESMSLAIQSAGAADIDSDISRLSLIVNYRIIDLFLYFGAIGTIGFSNSATLKSVPLFGDVKFKNDMTFTAGLEGGVSLGLFMVGAELGYFMGGDWEPEGVTVTGGAFNTDGIYAKAIVGVGF